MALSAEEKSRAAAIVERWFWQIDESRQYRFAGATKRLVRFYESAPLSADVFALVLEYLRSMENVAEISLNHKKVKLDGKWNALGAWYATAPGAQWAGTESAKVRVYQALSAASEMSGGDMYVVENGCKYKVSHTYFWDVAAAPTTQKSSSGVQVTIQGLSRDKESGLFSYVLEKRETVQQDIQLYESSKTIFETRSEEVHHGVKDSSVASTGPAASAGGGKLVERHVTKNPDCTSDVQIVEREESAVSDAVQTARKTLRGTVVSTTDRNQTNPLSMEGLAIGETRRSEKTPGGLYDNTTEKASPEPVGKIGEELKKTIFVTSEETLTNQKEEPTDKVADAAGGVVKSRSVRKTEEGTVDVTERTDTELPVSGAVVVKRRTLRGTLVTVTDRNQTPPPAEEPENPEQAAALLLGETRREEKTQGGLVDVTSETLEHNPAATPTAKQVSEDAFRKVTEDTVNHPPIVNPDGTITFPSVSMYPTGGGEGSVQQTVRLQDDGTADVTTRTVTDKELARSQRTMRRTAFRSVVTYRDTAIENHSETPPSDFQTSVLEVDKRPASKNDGDSSVLREVRADATENGKRTIERVYVFPEKQEWDIPEVSTKFRYRKTKMFRNCKESEAREIFTEVETDFESKIKEWGSAGRLPASHDIDPQMVLNDDGLYDGSVTVRANWSEDSAGQDGDQEFIIASFTFDYWSFNPRGDRATITNYAGYTEFKGYNAVKVKKRRIIGCGKGLLDQLLAVGTSSPFCGIEPQFSFNTTTGVWTLEIATGIYPQLNNGEAAKVLTPDEINPDKTGSAEKEIEKILDKAKTSEERFSGSSESGGD